VSGRIDDCRELWGIEQTARGPPDRGRGRIQLQSWTGFDEWLSSAHVHRTQRRASIQLRRYERRAVLLAEACNISLEPLVRNDVPWLRGRLGWVHQNYLRAETLMQANARLVDYQATLAS
jgi:Tn3 transposase DDE domain